MAARLKTATGTRAFVKAVGPELNPESPGIHRAEARIAAALPEGTPAPRLLGFFDEDGWVVLVGEDIEDAPPVLPWEAAELARVLDAVAELAVALTPAPIDAPAVADRFGEEFQGWRRLVEAQRRGDDDLVGLDTWACGHLADLAALETGWEAAAEGPTLVQRKHECSCWQGGRRGGRSLHVGTRDGNQLLVRAGLHDAPGPRWVASGASSQSG